MVGEDMSVIEVQEVTKRFGDFTAIDQITLDFAEGEIHAICGENGAGKSTFMNMLFGLLQPTEGQILLHGKPVDFHSPKEAIHSGIGMVHQHFKLVPSLTVFENVLLGEEMTQSLKIDRQREKESVQATIDNFGFDLDAGDKIEAISVGAQQRAEIIKMLHRNVDILILDEPTAVLTPQETDELLDKLIELKNLGKTIIIITHKLDEVKKCADRVTVIRRGKKIGTVYNQDVTEKDISRMMVGRDVSLDFDKKPCTCGDLVLQLNNVTATSKLGKKVLEGIDLEVKQGEIVGIAGIEGNGQAELMELFSGTRKLTDGEMIYKGKKINCCDPAALRKMGFGLVPEDRYRDALNATMSIWENMIAGRHKDYCKLCFFDDKVIRQVTKELIEEYDIRNCDNIDALVSTLSGGNAQKIIMAREISCNPDIMIMSQPTRGVDIGSIEFIHQRIIQLRDEGKAVIVISSELTEIMNLSDRIYVMHKGKIVGERETSQTNKEDIGLLMAGINHQANREVAFSYGT